MFTYSSLCPQHVIDTLELKLILLFIIFYNVDLKTSTLM